MQNTKFAQKKFSEFSPELGPLDNIRLRVWQPGTEQED
jgi:hypothetical protein